MLYYNFWLGFIIHFYIIFGTNLLTGGPAQNCCFFAYFSVSQKTVSNGVQAEWNLRECDPEDLDPTSRHQPGRHEVGGAPTPQARPPPSWGPCCSTDVLLPPIYTYVPPNYQIRSQNPNSTAATFCTREIPSWGLFRRPGEGALITEGFYINTIASPMMCE